MATALQASRCRYTIGLAAALSLGALVPGVATPSQAEVKFEGNVTHLRVTTNKDTISDVLAALAATFNVRYHTAIRLDAAANETYSGSLRQVIGRQLDGHNYVVRDNHDVFDVIIIASKGERLIPAQALPQGDQL